MPPPANDNFANAQVISGLTGSVEFDNTDATAEVGEPENDDYGDNSVWFIWECPEDADYDFWTTENFGTLTDTTITVYSGSTLGTLTELGFNDDADDEIRTGGFFSEIIGLSLTEGVTYHIKVTGFGDDDVGTGELNWYGFVLAPLTNDSCAGATVLTGLSGIVHGHNIGATSDSPDPLHSIYATTSQKAVWYKYTAPTRGYFYVEFKFSGLPPSLSSIAATLLTGSACGSLVLARNDCEIRSVDSLDTSGSLPRFPIAMVLDAGETVWIQVDSLSGAEGHFRMDYQHLAVTLYDKLDTRRTTQCGLSTNNGPAFSDSNPDLVSTVLFDGMVWGSGYITTGTFQHFVYRKNLDGTLTRMTILAQPSGTTFVDLDASQLVTDGENLWHITYFKDGTIKIPTVHIYSGSDSWTLIGTVDPICQNDVNSIGGGTLGWPGNLTVWADDGKMHLVYSEAGPDLAAETVSEISEMIERVSYSVWDTEDRLSEDTLFYSSISKAAWDSGVTEADRWQTYTKKVVSYNDVTLLIFARRLQAGHLSSLGAPTITVYDISDGTPDLIHTIGTTSYPVGLGVVVTSTSNILGAKESIVDPIGGERVWYITTMRSTSGGAERIELRRIPVDGIGSITPYRNDENQAFRGQSLSVGAQLDHLSFLHENRNEWIMEKTDVRYHQYSHLFRQHSAGSGWTGGVTSATTTAGVRSLSFDEVSHIDDDYLYGIGTYTDAAGTFKYGFIKSYIWRDGAIFGYTPGVLAELLSGPIASYSLVPIR